MNEALYDLSMGIEEITVIGLTCIAWAILAVGTWLYALWIKKNIKPIQ